MIPELGRPLKEAVAICSSILAGKFHRQRSLANYSPWGCKEVDTTEHTHTQRRYMEITGSMGETETKQTCSEKYQIHSLLV